MSGLSVSADPARAEARASNAQRHAQRLRVRRAILTVLALALTVWLVGAAQSPSSGPIERVVMLVIAALVPLHVIFWQLNGIKLLVRDSGLPRMAKAAVAYTALASGPMVLYPLGAIALLVSIFSGGGAAAPALAVSGFVLLLPIIALFLIALMFILSGYKGG